jgi:hypothetical protein
VIVLSAAALLAGYLYAVWVRRGRPAGVSEAEMHMEEEPEPSGELSGSGI